MSDEIEVKVCSNADCKNEQPLPITKFAFRKDTGKHRDQCIDCVAERRATHYQNNKEEKKKIQKQYYEDNKPAILEKAAIYREDNRDLLKIRSRIHYENNKETLLIKAREYREDNRDEINARQNKYKEDNKEELRVKKKIYRDKNIEKIRVRTKKYREDNREILQVKKNEWQREKRKTDPAFKLRHDISISINKALKDIGKRKGGSFLKYLPYTMEQLRQHIESQFESWMTWNNRGIYDPKTWNDNDQSTWTWQIDHIIPQSTFHYETMDCQEFRDCWALFNLRPLNAKQNQLDGSTRVRH